MTSILFGRSDFSLGQSVLSPEKLADMAADHGYKAAVLCDVMTISGAIRFSKQCEKRGIKPIVGATIVIYDDPLVKDKKVKQIPYRFDVFIKNERGYEDLCQLLSVANREDHFYYVPRVSFAEFLSSVSGGNLLIAASDSYNFFQRDDWEQLKAEIVGRVPEVWGRLQTVETPLFDVLNRKSYEHTERQIYADTVLYTAAADDADARDVLNTIVGNGKIARMRRPYQRNQFAIHADDHAKKTTAVVQRIFKKLSHDRQVKALFPKQFADNNQAFADAIEWKWKNLPVSLPKMADDEFRALVDLCKDGWGKRLKSEVLGFKPADTQLPAYKERLAYELGVLRDLNFSGYFLLVSNIVNWSREQGVLTGPGRGSVGGSLVAFLIGMTDVDPIRFNLIFERFINPERLDLPDADLDFMSSRRSEVIRYIEQTWGEDKVAGISNYSYLGASSALRDVGRIYELNPLDYDCSKFVPKEHGVSYKLDKAADAVPAIAAFRSKYDAIWRQAVRLEGCMRNLGKHAAGVVVAAEPLTKRAVVELRSGERTINWDKRVSEDAGLVKLDVLGLSTLDVLKGALDRIEANTGSRPELLSVPLNDKDTLKAFGRGETSGVFQFEGSGMRGLLRNLALSGDLSFEDLSAATALYRPGPMDSGLLEDYVKVKQGLAPPRVEHPNMKAALMETGGVIVYQEQVMQIARDLCGFTMAQSDKLRKAMGKKDPVMMAEQRDKFVKGAVTVSGMPEMAAQDLFNKIEKFAGYAFNKSHSVAYTILSFWTQYLKTHHAVEFYAASLSTADEDKTKVIIKDAERDGIVIMPPDINISTERYEAGVLDDGRIALYAPFAAVKGCSANGSATLITIRNLAREEISTPIPELPPKPARTEPAELIIWKGIKRIVDRKTAYAHATPERPIVSASHLQDLVSAQSVGRFVTSRVIDHLTKVGAFGSVDPTELPPLDDARLADQIELMPGVISRSMKAKRTIEATKGAKMHIAGIINEFNVCDQCSLRDKIHVNPRMGSSPKFMVVFDSPSAGDEKAGKLLESGGGKTLREALTKVGLSINDGYYTSLVKATREGDKLKNEQIIACSQWLKKEIEILKPPVILTLGRAAQQYLAPEIDGSWAEIAGMSVYRRDVDCTIVVGFNPGMLFHDPTREGLLLEVLEKVKSIVRG